VSAWPVTVAEGAVSIEIADAVYPIAAIHGALVLHLEENFIRVTLAAPGRTRITLRPKRGAATESELRSRAGELLNELLHQALRLDVGARTEKLRELVIGKGILAAETAPETEVAFAEDPLGIARPWEERFQGESK
jgi:hypothetical protein